MDRDIISTIPCPLRFFEQILSDEANIDFRGIKARQIERIRLQELMNGDMVSDATMNNILGAVAFYDLYDGRLELLRSMSSTVPSPGPQAWTWRRCAKPFWAPYLKMTGTR